MHLQRFVWKRTMQIATENPEVKDVMSYFWDFQFDLYVKAQAGAVRRQADVNAQVASLGQLLTEIAETPTLLTRDRYLDRWGAGEEDEGERQYWQRAGRRVWSEHYAGRIGDHLDPFIVEADLTELRDESEKVRRYVDKYVAHLDANVMSRGSTADSPVDDLLPTLNEVHDGIDLIGRLFRRYHGLFSSAEILDLTPIIQHDWEAVFRVQWLPDPELPKELREYQEQRVRQKAEEGEK